MAPHSRTPSISPVSPTLEKYPDDGGPESETHLSENAPDFALAANRSLGDRRIQAFLPELFDENVLAKCYRVGTNSLDGDRNPRGYPETVARDGPNKGQYELREPEFWTCGFFPGTLYALLERSIKYPNALGLGNGRNTASIHPHLLSLCQTWSEPLHPMSSRTDTHDMGFIAMPALQRSWELTGNRKSLDSILHAAYSLATRYIPQAGVIRSWDCLLKKDISVTDMSENAIVIIDSVCNLDLLFYASAHSGDRNLAEIATTHARTLIGTHLRQERNVTPFPSRCYTGELYSTCHVANIDPRTGILRWRWTAQGYSNESTWSRGQAWAILGYAQTYSWTKDTVFLDTACGVAEYFLYRLETAPASVEIPVVGTQYNRDTTGEPIRGRYVPLWDFDAPVNHENPLRDSSAGIIAANGMLILSQALQSVNQHSLSRYFFTAALRIVRDCTDLSLAPEAARFVGPDSNSELKVKDTTPGKSFEGLLKNGTANNNETARRRYADHGLVYADYYFVEFGNRLLNMGLV